MADAQYDAGVFGASGVRVPRRGGVILADNGISRDGLAAALAEDLFNQRELADYLIVEFDPGRTAPGLEQLLAVGG